MGLMQIEGCFLTFLVNSLERVLSAVISENDFEIGFLRG